MSKRAARILPTCRAGHPILASSTAWYTHANGRSYARCRLCISANGRRYYNLNLAEERERGRVKYHARKQA